MTDQHFEWLFEVKPLKKGRDLVADAVALMRYAGDVARGLCADATVTLRPMVYLPLGDSPSVVVWNDAMLDNLGEAQETPSLYYFKDPRYWGERLLDDGLEEYRHTLHVLDGDCRMLYRCYRDRGRREFQLGLYVFLEATD